MDVILIKDHIRDCTPSIGQYRFSNEVAEDHVKRRKHFWVCPEVVCPMSVHRLSSKFNLKSFNIQKPGKN